MLNSIGSSSAKLSPTNPAPNGAMATAEVLKQQGVKVSQSDELGGTLTAISAAGAGHVTVLLYDQQRFLSAEQLKKLSESGARLVVINPGPLDLKAISSEISSAGFYNAGSDHQDQTVPASCNNPDAVAAQQIDGGRSALYRGPVVCFPTDSGEGGKIGQLAQSTDGQLTVIGNTAVFSNDRLAHSGNAALAFRLLGHTEQLIWYLPSTKDLPVSEQHPDLASLQPGWLVPISIWAFLVALLAMFWKGRRDGPLVEEPLPVAVKASETAIGRARLYQDGRALDRAAASLRSATLYRLAKRLRLGPAASKEAIVAAAIQHSHLPETEVARILLKTQPGTDKEFLRWSQEVENLERELEKDQ
ncbi:hypothetical protein FHU41_001134 [Psychromicrobium silvestre]|uniref:DUF4350 domain-containing protein n=1 Tax=Psychromicrobium silvestre TaxID=1645614 RepID=A0A7Y9LSR8_9MICC|nr:DUF4350 domain-containing protein [Psychromicrobium silvestre]NYE94913.1 hypothetical protein [Psychromicrobium silvestre]